MNRKNGKQPDLALSKTKSLDDQALDYLTKNGTTTVPALLDALRANNSRVTDAEVANLVWRLAERGKIDVEDVPPQVRSLREYLGHWERNVWFYASVAVSLMTVLSIYTLPTELPLVAVRWVLGSVFVLFLPGYVSVEALFPKGRDLDTIERFALSFGLSLALVPLVGLLLNYSPWGIRLTPLVISLVILTLGLVGVGVRRQYGISARLEDIEANMANHTRQAVSR
jgi:hypothetical protein